MSKRFLAVRNFAKNLNKPGTLSSTKRVNLNKFLFLITMRN